MSEPTLVPRIDDSNALTIDYSVVALEEIRAEVAQGLLKFSRGGMEVG
ncbi:MAG: hypothetical protein RL328_2900, partial [Acidobacteriota bacterium]